MKLDHGHYVPVLKLKDAEKGALRALKPEIRGAVIPLFEVVERKEDANTDVKPSIEKHLDKAFKKLGESVSYCPKYFLDTREVESDGRALIETVFRRASELGRPFTPVTGIKRAEATAVALEHSQWGLAIRLTRTQLEADKIGKSLERLVTAHKLSSDKIDLIVDLCEVEDMLPAGALALTHTCLSAIPEPKSWRSLILTGCGFPKSMGLVKPNSFKLVDRVEWLSWNALAQTADSVRIPTFSDCGIQHRSGVEGFDPRTMAASAAIRYALGEQWLLVKGRSTKLVRHQFSKFARELALGSLKSHFAGHKHCVGCERIRRVAEGDITNNSPTSWRSFGTIHHITRTVENIRAVCAQLDAGGRQ
jgi:hypothetical protein